LVIFLFFIIFNILNTITNKKVYVLLQYTQNINIEIYIKYMYIYMKYMYIAICMIVMFYDNVTYYAKRLCKI